LKIWNKLCQSGPTQLEVSENNRKYAWQRSNIFDNKLSLFDSVFFFQESSTFAEPARISPVGTKLIEQEGVAVGNIKMNIFCGYFKAAGLWMSTAALVFMILSNGKHTDVENDSLCSLNLFLVFSIDCVQQYLALQLVFGSHDGGAHHWNHKMADH